MPRHPHDPDDDLFPFRRTIRTDKGIQARSRRGAVGKRWWSARWIEHMAGLSADGGARLARGRSYARQGQVLSLEETRGGVQALVQGSRRRPYEVTIGLERHPEPLRQAALAVLAGESGHLAHLLAGELPEGIEEAFLAASAPLLPESADDLCFACDCPDPARPCKHVAAVHYLLAERLDDDPFLLLRLRGWDGERFVEDLRRRVADRADGEGEAEAGPEAAAEVASAGLDEDTASFWSAGRALDQARPRPAPPTVPLPILKRLGQPDFVNGDIAALLGPAIARAGERARALGRAGEPPEETSGPVV